MRIKTHWQNSGHTVKKYQWILSKFSKQSESWEKITLIADSPNFCAGLFIWSYQNIQVPFRAKKPNLSEAI